MYSFCVNDIFKTFSTFSPLFLYLNTVDIFFLSFRVQRAKLKGLKHPPFAGYNWPYCLVQLAAALLLRLTIDTWKTHKYHLVYSLHGLETGSLLRFYVFLLRTTNILYAKRYFRHQPSNMESILPRSHVCLFKLFWQFKWMDICCRWGF